MSDNVQILAKLTRALNRISVVHRSYNRETMLPVTAKAVIYTAYVLQCIIDIISNNQTMNTSPLWGRLSLVAHARIRMVYMLDIMRADLNFPLRQLQHNALFGVPNFIVLSLIASGYMVNEIRDIIRSVVTYMYLHGEGISPSFVSPHLLEQVLRTL